MTLDHPWLVELGSGRMVFSEIEAPNLSLDSHVVNLSYIKSESAG
jgi:hypothetical protein